MKVLVLFATRKWPMRLSQSQHLWAFKKYLQDAICYYVNMEFGRFPKYLINIHFDLVIFDWSFLGCRVKRQFFKQVVNEIEHLKYVSATKICLPQDEFTSMDILCDFIADFQIYAVFSVAPESEWPLIYRNLDFTRVKFFRVLTGYLDEDTVSRWITRIDRQPKTIDIGYRTVSTAIWGRFNLLKAKLADVFSAKAAERHLTYDIKVGAEHFKMGEDWLNFLSKCRFTLGIEGGSHILDWDGSLFEQVIHYQISHPYTSGEDIANALIPSTREGEVKVVALSPRHLEACLTKTCQILVEGSYNNILTASTHYIALKQDFSNIDIVLQAIHDEDARNRMVEAAFKDIVLSDKYTYRAMVSDITKCLPSSMSASHRIQDHALHKAHVLNLWFQLAVVWVRSRLRPSVKN